MTFLMCMETTLPENWAELHSAFPHPPEIFFPALVFDGEQTIKGQIKIRGCGGEQTMAIDNDAGVADKGRGDGVAQTKRTCPHFAGHNGYPVDVPFVRA